MKKSIFEKLNDLMIQKNSRICAGLDPSWENIPTVLKQEYHCEEEKFLNSERCKKILTDYCERYIFSICDVVPAIKINSAFFEQYNMQNEYEYVARMAKSCNLFVIGDVKRADIGSTSEAYAEAFLGENSPFDAITVNPYFGTDGVMPFLKLAKKNEKGVFVLVKTSNPSSCEIQDLELKDGSRVYEAVAKKVLHWAKEVDYEHWEKGKYPMVGAVVGATSPKQAKDIVHCLGDIFNLVPGYGAQGATADDVVVNFNFDGTGAIVNSSRGIMNAYKSDRWKEKYQESEWTKAAKAEAKRATKEINKAIKKYFQ